jgi:hypothetical protein
MLAFLPMSLALKALESIKRQQTNSKCGPNCEILKINGSNITAQLSQWHK